MTCIEFNEGAGIFRLIIRFLLNKYQGQNIYVKLYLHSCIYIHGMVF